MIHRIDITTSKRSQAIDITGDVEKLVRKSGVKEGVCYLSTPHTTSALTINENADPMVRKDIINALDVLVPRDGSYAHVEGNSDAHIKSSLLGEAKTIFIEKGSLKLGTWQGIFFSEFDGPRKRQVWVKIKGD